MQFLFLLMMFYIDTIIAWRLKVFFGDVYNGSLDKIERRNTFFNGFTTYGMFFKILIK